MIVRIKRLIGRFLYGIARHMPESFAAINIGQKGIRAFCGKLILAKCGKDVNIEKGAQFASSVELGDRSGIGIDARLNGKCVIGDDVMMGPECMILTANHRFDRTDVPMDVQGFDPEKPVTIENDVWIGARVIILPGVTIGTGSVIGAGAVVTRNIPPYSIAAGVPAKVIKTRTDNCGD